MVGINETCPSGEPRQFGRVDIARGEAAILHFSLNSPRVSAKMRKYVRELTQAKLKEQTEVPAHLARVLERSQLLVAVVALD